MPSYFVRITHAYEIAKPIIHEWATRCDSMLVYEHSQATKTSKGKTHIHVILVNTSVDKKQLRNIAAATKIPVKGNENMSFKAYDGANKPITYMSKGKVDPMYNKGYEVDVIEAAKAAWVEPEEYVKESPWEQLYLEYKPFAPSIQKIDWEAWANSLSDTQPTVDNFTPLDTHARTWLNKKLRGIWEPRHDNMLRCIVKSHCWQNNIKIPLGWKP